MRGRSAPDRLRFLAVFGRTVEAETLMAYRSLRAAVMDLYLRSRGPLRLLAQRNLLVAVGARAPDAYVAISRSLGGGEGTVREMSERSGEPLNSSFRRKVAHLEERGWLVRGRRYGGRETSAVRYRVRRAADRFYFGLVDSQAAPRDGRQSADLWARRIRPVLPNYVDRFLPHVLRRICRKQGVAPGLPVSGACGPWRGFGAFGRPVQFDLVAPLEDGRTAIGRVFSDRADPGRRAVLRFRLDLELAGDPAGSTSGRPSGPTELQGDRVVPVFFRPSGFSTSFVQAAERLPGRSAVLLDAERLLAEAS